MSTTTIVDFSTTAKITIEHLPGQSQARMVETSVTLELPSIVSEGRYFKDKDSLTDDGHRVVTTCLVQGLISNIHTAHQNNNWDSAQHLRYIITELTRGFAEVVDIVKS